MAGFEVITEVVVLTKYCFERTVSGDESAVLDWEGKYSSKLIFLDRNGREQTSCDVEEVLSLSPKRDRSGPRKRFRTAFRAWVAFDGHVYNLDVDPDGRAAIDLPPQLVADGWTCGVLPEKRETSSKPLPDKKEQVFRCERDNTAVGTVYAARVEARAACIIGAWDTDQQGVVLANKTKIEKKAAAKRGTAVTITKTTSVLALIGIGCSTVDLDVAGSEILQQPMFPEAPSI